MFSFPSVNAEIASDHESVETSGVSGGTGRGKGKGGGKGWLWIHVTDHTEGGDPDFSHAPGGSDKLEVFHEVHAGESAERLERRTSNKKRLVTVRHAGPTAT